MYCDTKELQRVQAVIQIGPKRSYRAAGRSLPDTAIVSREDGRAGSIIEKGMRVGVQAVVVLSKCRASVSRFLHAVGTGAAARRSGVSTQIDFTRIVRI